MKTLVTVADPPRKRKATESITVVDPPRKRKVNEAPTVPKLTKSATVADPQSKKNATEAPAVPKPTKSVTDPPRKRKAIEASTTLIKPKLSKNVPSTTNLQNSDAPDDFYLPAKEWNLKITTWNVAGLRALVKKDGMKFIEKENPDIVCLQETKCLEEEVPTEAKIDGYHRYWLGMKGGQAGVALYSKTMPYDVTYGINDAEMDQEARLITAEYTKFYLLCVYVPNAGRKLVNLEKRIRWDQLFRNYLTELNGKKPVIVCGDLNVAHQEIDLANPKSNKKNAGFTQEERDGMTDMLKIGFVDTFRDLYPDKAKAYTFWTYMGNARAKNVGWRLDYALVSEKFKENVVDITLRSSVLGSDHCPATLFLKL